MAGARPGHPPTTGKILAVSVDARTKSGHDKHHRDAESMEKMPALPSIY
jgi:hypothetical protein